MESYEDIFDARGHLYNEAGARCPNAREAERRELISWLLPKPGEVLCDVPAGGGYVAEGIRSYLDAGKPGAVLPTTRIICIEPSPRFAAAIDRKFEHHGDPLTALSLPDATVDGIASLAGLHHFADKLPVFQEWTRILKPGGRAAVADVQAGTDVAAFLNEFVHQSTPGGHEGIFIEPGDLTESMSRVGFAAVLEELRTVSWEFESEESMATFCRTLFGLTLATVEQVDAGIRKYLPVHRTGNGIQMEWRLRYGLGLR